MLRPGPKRHPKKQTSDKLSKLAARILRGGRYNEADVLALAASVLSQDETRGKRKR